MKKFLYMAVAAIAALSSCSNDNDIVPNENGKGNNNANAPVFTATIEGDATSRTTIETGSAAGKNKVNWETTDEVSINGAVYSVAPGTTDATTATLTYKSGDAPSAPYKAYYPASMYSAGTATLPASYTYEEGKFNMPMYAESENTSLALKNICGVFAIKVTSAEMAKVTKITVTSDKAISGPCTITDNTATATGTADANKTVTLDCGEGVTPSAEGTTFYLPVPAISGAKLYIHVAGTINSAKAASYAPLLYTQAMNASNVTIARNKKYNINFKTSLAKFSVSATKKVNFTNGNLQATYSTSTKSYTWGFAAHQYESIKGRSSSGYAYTGNNTIDNQTNGAKVDLFSWSTDASLNNWGIQTSVYSNNNEYTKGNFKDWGLNFEGKGYYTLLLDEWKYLLNIENESSGARTQTNRIARANVNGVKGFLIFPDNYNCTTAVSGEGMATVNSVTADIQLHKSQPTLGLLWNPLVLCSCLFLVVVSQTMSVVRVATAHTRGSFAHIGHLVVALNHFTSPKMSANMKITIVMTVALFVLLRL